MLEIVLGANTIANIQKGQSGYSGAFDRKALRSWLWEKNVGGSTEDPGKGGGKGGRERGGRKGKGGKGLVFPKFPKLLIIVPIVQGRGQAHWQGTQRGYSTGVLNGSLNIEALRDTAALGDIGNIEGYYKDLINTNNKYWTSGYDIYFLICVYSPTRLGYKGFLLFH